MADGRNMVLLRAYLNGFPIMASLEGFTPPPITKETEDMKGGRFIAEPRVIGLTMGDWSLNLAGADADLVNSMGNGRDNELTVEGSVENEDGSATKIEYNCSGEVTVVDEGEIKVGKQSVTVTGKPYAYRKKEAGNIVHDVNNRTQKAVVGGTDLLERHRKNVSLS